MERLFNSYDVIRAVKASQVRRNKAAEAKRKREQLAATLGHYFNKIPLHFNQ